jgi:hypothetical protein
MNRDDVVAWLAAREPAAPALLAGRLAAVAREVPAERLGGSMTDAMSELGLYTLDRSLGRGETGNEVALDLLAADAFVTYAFEAAAEEDADVGRAARDLVGRVTP